MSDARDDRFDERLALTSRPPDDLLARVQARRAVGDRVLLPHVPTERAPAVEFAASARTRPARPARRPWRWAAAPAGLAAVALLTVLGVRGGRPEATPTPGGGPAAAVPDAAARGAASRSRAGAAPAPDASPASAGPQAAPAPSATRPRAGSPPAELLPEAGSERLRSAPLAPGTDGGAEVSGEVGAQVRPVPAPAAPSVTGEARATLRSFADRLALALPAGPGTPDALQRPMLDSVARVLAREPARRAVVRYVDPSFTRESASWQLASRVSDYLVARGVAPERLTLTRVTAVASGGDAIEVVVGGP